MAEALIIGATGGREHALGQALHEEGLNVAFTHGGNGGTQDLGENLALIDPVEIANHAANRSIDLAVIGPEAPLIAGQADRLSEREVATFGPGVDGAQLEASKAFTALINSEAGILQPDFVITSNLADAGVYIKSHGANNIVIKASGTAGGKGALLPKSEEEAIDDVQEMLSGKKFGEAGKLIVLQRRLDPSRPELSAKYIIDGNNFALLPLTQDHKRLLEGDEGPNTGGMGAYAPLLFETPELVDSLMGNGERLVGLLKAKGINYRGVVYAGVMLDAENDDQPSVLEYNVRFGDPETQVLLPRLALAGVNVYDLLESTANGSLDRELRGQYIGRGLGGAAITFCVASEGYPDSPVKGRVVSGLDRDYEGVIVQHAGTRLSELGQVETSGGRVLYVTATGEDIGEAAARACAAIGRGAIWFEGAQYRGDIGWQARTAV